MRNSLGLPEGQAWAVQGSSRPQLYCICWRLVVSNSLADAIVSTQLAAGAHLRALKPCQGWVPVTGVQVGAYARAPGLQLTNTSRCSAWGARAFALHKPAALAARVLANTECTLPAHPASAPV